MKRFLPILLFVTGCATLVQTKPFKFESGFLYSRITDCTAQDVPTPLDPSKSDPTPPFLKAPQQLTAEEGKMSAQGDTTHCTTLEVGAKSYADTISAIGVALAGIAAYFGKWFF